MSSTQGDFPHRAPRMRALIGAKILVKGRSSFDCVIRSRSNTGFGLSMGSTAGVPDTFQLRDEKSGEIYDCQVAWRKSNKLGVRIVEDVQFEPCMLPSHLAALPLENN